MTFLATAASDVDKRDVLDVPIRRPLENADLDAAVDLIQPEDGFQIAAEF